MKKTQNIIKRLGVICFTFGLITACNEYDANRLNMNGNEDGKRIDSNSKHVFANQCNNCTLYNAVRNGNEAYARALIKAGANVNTRYGKNGHSLLMIAVKYGHEPCVNALIDAGADINARYGENQHSVLIVAAKYGHEPCVRTLIKAGADISYSDRGFNTALVVAVKYEHEPCVNALIEAWDNISRFYLDCLIPN